MALFGQNVFGLMISIVAFVFFLVGLVSAQMGMTKLIRIASYRATRRPGHDDYFVTAKRYERHLAELDKRDGGGEPSNTQPSDMPDLQGPVLRG